MLQLDPAKRIPLSKVLEHRWMQEGEDGSTARTALAQNHQRNSSSNLLLNDKVMLAIQRLNFNTELVKEVISFYSSLSQFLTTRSSFLIM